MRTTRKFGESAELVQLNAQAVIDRLLPNSRLLALRRSGNSGKSESSGLGTRNARVIRLLPNLGELEVIRFLPFSLLRLRVVYTLPPP
jgi:hypothetical protein